MEFLLIRLFEDKFNRCCWFCRLWGLMTYYLRPQVWFDCVNVWLIMIFFYSFLQLGNSICRRRDNGDKKADPISDVINQIHQSQAIQIKKRYKQDNGRFQERRHFITARQNPNKFLALSETWSGIVRSGNRKFNHERKLSEIWALIKLTQIFCMKY